MRNFLPFHSPGFSRRWECRRFFNSSMRPDAEVECVLCARGAATIRISIQRKREAQMKLTVKAAAIAFLAAGLVVSYAQTSGTTPPAKKHAAAKPAAPAGPTVQQQIDEMRSNSRARSTASKSDLAAKDEQLKQAQQAAADAQAAAAKAEADAQAQQQAITDNSSAVTTLQSTVSDLEDATRFRSPPRSPMRPRTSKRRSTILTSFTSRESLFRRPAASWLPKLCGVREPRAAISILPSPASRWTIPRRRS